MDFDTWLVYFAGRHRAVPVARTERLLALTHGALHGRRKALFTIFGGCVGFVGRDRAVDVRHRRAAADRPSSGSR
jgi:hypothetical protein